MNLKLTTFLLFLTIAFVNGQNNNRPFSQEDFATDKYATTFTEIIFHNLILKFITVKELYQDTLTKNDCEVFLKIYKNNKLIKNKGIGRSWSEGMYGFPLEQPLDKYFIYSYFGEWNGEMTLIDTSGESITFPGYHWALSKDKRFIFTKANYPDSDLPVTKFDVEAGKYQTKSWHYSLNGEPWKEVQPTEYRELEYQLCN